MAIFHLSVKIISRSSGRSAIAAAAYRAGEKLKDEEVEKFHDFSKKRGVVYSEIQLPENAPNEYKDRQTLWNKVQEVETRSDAQLAREVEVALPQELDRKKQIELVHDYIQEQFVNKGMIADWSIHDKGDGNPHAHIMLTTRSLKKDGSWAPKQKSTYLLDKNGEKIPQIDPKTGKQKIGARGRKMWKRTTIAYNDWNNRENVELWRSEWAKQVNKYLEPSKKIDNRSYKRQGIERIPTIHEGYVARKIEENGGNSDRVNINTNIKKINTNIKNENIILGKIQEFREWLIRQELLEKLRKRAINAIAKIIKENKKAIQRLEDKMNERIREISRQVDSKEQEFREQERTVNTAITKETGAIKFREQTVTDGITESDIEHQKIRRREREIANITQKQRLSRSNGTEKTSKRERSSNQARKERLAGKETRNQYYQDFTSSKGRSR